MRKILSLLMLFIVGIPMLKAQEVTTWNSTLTPVTKDALVASAGTGAYYAFRMPSNSKPGWCDFVNVAGALNNLSSAYLFRIENGSASGKYRLTRKSDGKQLSGNAAFAASGIDLTLTSREPSGMTDYDTGYSSSTPFVSFDNPSGNHYNCGQPAGGLQFRGGTGGWSVYVTYGPFYVVTINAVDENSNPISSGSREVVCYDGTIISAPEIYGYDLTSGGTSYTVSGSDYTWNLTYTKITTHDVTLNITGDVTKSIVLNDVPEGTEINIASQLGVNSSFITFSPASFTGPSSDQTIDVTATQTLPFATDGTQYFMKMKGKYATTESTNSQHSTLQIQNSYLWTFSGNAIDGFKLYNVGADAYAKVSNSDNSVATFVSESEASYFALSASSYNDGTGEGGFCLKLAGTTNCYLNDRDSKLSTWNDNRATNDYGSMFKFESLSPVILAKLNELTSMTNYVGGVQAEALEAGHAFKTKLDEVTANPTVAGYNEVITLAESYKVAPADGGYYRIVSAYSGFPQEKALYNDGGTMKWKSYAAEDASMVLKFIKNGDKWKIYVPSADAYMAGNTGTTTTDATSAADYTFTDFGNAVLNINDGTGNLHANGHGNGTGTDGTLINYGSGAGGASSWYVIRYGSEVSEDQLIAPYQTSVDTVYQTYATSEKVIVANPGVKVYKVTGVAAEKATIEEAGTSVVPASTGVILSGERGKTFTMLRVTTDVASHYADNVLVQGDGTAQTGHFVLAYREADTDAHFYKIGTLEIPANRAYLPASYVSSTVAALALNFGDDDELTAIESLPAQAESAQGQAFDLQGRRVSKLQKGIYIVGGKKVMVK